MGGMTCVGEHAACTIKDWANLDRDVAERLILEVIQSIRLKFICATPKGDDLVLVFRS